MTLAAATANLIERELQIDAPPQTVWRYFTEPERMLQWMGSAVTLEPRPGGQFHLDYNGFDRMSGRFLEVTPHSRIVFSWGWETLGDATPPGASRVEVTFTPNAGGTLLRLVHSGLEAHEAESHAQGWDMFLPFLAESAKSNAPAQPAADPLSASETFASRLNTALCDLRYIVEGMDEAAWQRPCPGTGWTAGGNAAHIVGHLALAHFAAQTARGERGQLADFTADGLNAFNESMRPVNEAESPSTVLTKLRADGPGAVEAVKAIRTDRLDRSQKMAFAGGAELSAAALLEGPLLGDIAAHLADIRAALAN